MTKKKGPEKKSSQRIPNRNNVIAVVVDKKSKKIIYVTKDMLINQLYRDGPRIAATFDELARDAVRECSEVISMAQAMLMNHLPNLEDMGSEATCARLLHSAAHSYVAAIEVARKGYPRELGVLMRLIVETIATVLTISTDGGPALEKFRKGKLESTKCIGVAKKVLPFIGHLNGLLSNNFVHVTELQESNLGATRYVKGDKRLDFIIGIMKLIALLLDIVTEVVFAEDIEKHRYWRREGPGWMFEPTERTRDWMEKYSPQTAAIFSDKADVAQDAEQPVAGDASATQSVGDSPV